jgi:metal-responsive CopG/Arc/MetJ family transcriptional regulator
MKTAISIATPLLEETDRTARRLGLSRSRLVSLALADYLRQRRNREIVEQLNHVYGEPRDAEEQRSVAGMKAKFRSTIKDRW